MLQKISSSLQRVALLWVCVLALGLTSHPGNAAEETVNIPKANARLLDKAAAGDLEGVRDALRDGAEINTTDKWGRSPLHNAIFRRHQELAIYLVSQGSDLTLVDKEYGATPLHLAGMMNMTDVLRVMSKKNADPFAKSKNGWIAQHWAGTLGEGCCSGTMLKEYGWDHIMTAHQGIIADDIINEIKTRAKMPDFSCNCWCESDAKVEWQKAGCCGEARLQHTQERKSLGPDKDCENGVCSWTPQGSAMGGNDWGSCMTAPPLHDWWDGNWRINTAEGYRMNRTAWYDSPWRGGSCGAAGAVGSCGMGYWGNGAYRERAGIGPCGISEPPYDPSRRNQSCELYPSELNDSTVRTQCCTHKKSDGKLVRRVRIWQTRAHTHTDGNNKSFTHTHPFFQEIEVDIE